jgi:predicted GIY-YIG superfamily endonuclease
LAYALSERSESTALPSLFSLKSPRTMASSSECNSSTFFVALITACTFGETNDLELRLLKHQEGAASRFTADRRPVTMVYAEEHADHASALKRERQIKRWTRAKKEALIAGDRTRLKGL